MSHDVFISHASQDVGVAAAVLDALESRAIECWIAPRDVRPGDEWASAIVAAVEEARVLLVVFSEHANGSRHVRREVELAVESGCAVVPLRIERVEPAGALRYFIADAHWIDALTAPFETHLETLAGRIAGLLAEPPTGVHEVVPAQAAASGSRGVTPAFRVLGPVEVVAGGQELTLGGPKQRMLLAMLLAEEGHVVSIDRITDALWGDDAADGARNQIQVYVSSLRRALEPVAGALGIDAVIETRRPGYLVNVPDGQLDVTEFKRLTATARAAAQAEDPRQASARFTEALALWRGPAFADLAEEPAMRGVAAALDQARLTAETDRIELELTLGRHLETLDAARALVDAQPLDERLRGLLMVALYRSGRQADALAVYQQGRGVLVEELGIEPSPYLRDLEGLILQHAPELAAPDSAHGGRELATIIASSVLAPRAVLVVAGRRFPLERAVTTIGRRADRTVVLDDTKASRDHAEVRRAGDGFVLADTGSTNGTLLNGVRIGDPTPLRPGDEITIGTTILRFDET